MTDLEQLTRRDFIKLGCVLGVEVTFQFLLGTTAESKTKKQRQITFEEALANISLRQEYINQLVDREFGDNARFYFDETVYDHNKSLFKKNTIIDVNRALNDSQALEKIIRMYLRDSKFNKLTENDKKTIANKLRNLPSDRVELENYIRDRNRKLLNKLIYWNMGIYSNEFSKGMKSKLHVFGDTFKDFEFPINIASEPIVFPITEELIRARLQHEYVHAQDNFYGINFGNSLEINNSNYFKINPDVIEFVKETRAYIWQVEYSKEKFGISHIAYRASLITLIQYMNIYGKSIISMYQNGDLKADETKFIEYQINELKRRVPQIFQFLKYKI